jgi:hypothetical protein
MGPFHCNWELVTLTKHVNSDAPKLQLRWPEITSQQLRAAGSLRFGAEWLGCFFNRLMDRDLDCFPSLTTIVDWTSAESPVNTSRTRPESHGAVSEYSLYRNPSGRLCNSQSLKHLINCIRERLTRRDSWLVKHSLDS